MPCCLALIALATPRIAILLVVLFSDYIGTAYDSALVPFFGFFLMPTSTLAYAWAIHSRGSVEGFQLLVVVFAVLIDIGLVGGSARGAKERDD